MHDWLPKLIGQHLPLKNEKNVGVRQLTTGSPLEHEKWWVPFTDRLISPLNYIFHVDSSTTHIHFSQGSCTNRVGKNKRVSVRNQ